MKYKKFTIKNYRAIKGPLDVNLENKIIPLVGVNECGKTTILQAVLSFDSANDTLNDGKHVTDISNLYEIGDSDCEITATISINKNVVLNFFEEKIIEKTNEIEDLKEQIEAKASNNEDTSEIEDKLLPIEKDLKLFSDISERFSADDENEFDFEITRHLSDDNQYYSLKNSIINRFLNFKPYENDFLEIILPELPPILYSDDFNDRPSGEVLITKEGGTSEWAKIYTRVFNDALERDDFNIYDLFDEDGRTRKSTLSDVSSYLSENLTAAWAKFSNEKKSIKLNFDLKTENENDEAEEQRYLVIEVIEENDGKQRFFRIPDRSKGFIWYYNFIMKIQFNPKENTNENIVFLLDEPGSYLHETAQNELCEKLVEISNNEGVVIYCTHSPQLLNPLYIPLNKINIVSKPETEIFCKPIAQSQTKALKTTALQPIYEALNIPEFKFIKSDDEVVILEGIYDKYVLEMFLKENNKRIYFASANAKSIRDNIQYFIAFNTKYLALWDYDNEGIKSKEIAEKEFGLYEQHNFHLLPNIHSKTKVRMEEMFEKEDYSTIKKLLNLKENTAYEIVMGTLYFHKERTALIAKIKKELTSKAKNSFANLDGTISAHFKKLK